MLVQIPPVLQNIERITVTAHRRETPRDDVKHGSLAVWLEMEKTPQKQANEDGWTYIDRGVCKQVFTSKYFDE